MAVAANDEDLELAMRRRAALRLDPEFERRLAPLWSPWPKQQQAIELASESDEFLFGGAAGPGKTHWGINYTIDQMELYPGNFGGIFRRVYPSLRRTIIPRMLEILSRRIDPSTGLLATGPRANDRSLPMRAKWNENKSTFIFPNDSRLELASLQYVDDVHDYQGAEYGILFFEELTEFEESQWEYLLTRLRNPQPNSGIRPHAIATSNPGGVGHRWVKRRFVKPTPEDLDDGAPIPFPGTIWRPRYDPEVHSEDALPLRRCYLPATYTDNPSLLANDPGYISRLRAQNKKGMRAALEHGDWDALDSVEGALWSQEDLNDGRIEPPAYNLHVRRHEIVRRVIALDPNDADPDNKDADAFGVVVVAKAKDRQGYVEEAYEWNLTPAGLVQAVSRLADRVGADAIVCERNHGGKWMLSTFVNLGCDYPIRAVWASDSKRTRAEPISAMFENNPYRDHPYLVHLVGRLPDLEEELTTTSFSSGERSPNLLDAMVWGLWYLFIAEEDTTLSQGPSAGRRLRGRR